MDVVFNISELAERLGMSPDEANCWLAGVKPQAFIAGSEKDYSVPELAKVMGVSPTKVRRWIHSGELTAYNAGEGTNRPRWRIERRAVQAFKAGRGNSAKAPRKRRRLKDHQVKEFFR